MGSGFIYFIIIGMWAVYFLPQWLTTHEDRSGKSIQRYKNAMQVVAESNSNTKSENKVEDKIKIYFKRRLIIGSLFSLYILSLATAWVGALQWSTTFIPLTGLLIYFVNVRKQVAAAGLKTRRLKAIEKVTSSKVLTTPVPEQIREKRSSEHWISFADREEITGIIVVPKNRKEWKPSTVPKPVYTTAAKAIPSKRIIDLTVAGQWSAEQKLIKELSGRDDDFFDQTTISDEAESDRAVND